jgi:hypothetical protein
MSVSCRVELAALWDFAFAAELSSCRAVDADQAVNAGIASLTYCQLSTSIHRLALHPAGYCTQLWWIRGLSAWIAPPFIVGPTLETIKIRTDNDLLQRAALGRSLAKTHQFLAHANHENLCPGGRKPEEPVYCQHTTENPVFI